MKLDRKILEFKDAGAVGEGFVVPEFKADKAGTIKGYGSIFGNLDRGQDIVQAGAFKDSLAANGKIKMLWQHDPYKPIGVWDEVSEDAKGLLVQGRPLQDVEAGREALSLIKAGAIDGLSIGYRTIEYRETEIDGRYARIIEKAELWEVSIVTFPMNAEATIDAVKAAEMSQRDFERQLLRESKLSRQVVAALMRGGFDAVKALRDSGDSKSLDELRLAMLASVKSKQTILKG